MSDLVTQADVSHKRPSAGHKLLKKRKHRAERRKARVNPESPPTYGKYRGWES